MLCDIEEAALAKAVEGLKRTNADVDGAKADVSLKPELAAGGRRHIRPLWPGAHPVNNAGVGGGGPYGRWTEAGWNWTLGVNLMAAIWGIEIFGPLIEQPRRGWTHVSTASIAGLISNCGNTLQRIQIWRRRAFGGPAR